MVTSQAARTDGHVLSDAETVQRLLRERGRTYAQECGIQLRDEPAPLFQLLLMTKLMGARIGVGQAVRAMRGVLDAGWTTLEKLAATTWRQRVTVLNHNGYARYDERTARTFEELTERLQADYGGDLRRLWAAAHHDADAARRLLLEFPGIGPVGADIFLREVQAVWPDLVPYVDQRARSAAAQLRLPEDPHRLARLADGPVEFAQLVAALVRSSFINS